MGMYKKIKEKEDWEELKKRLGNHRIILRVNENRICNKKIKKKKN